MSNQNDANTTRTLRVNQFARSWLQASEHAFNSVLEANRATMAVFGLTNGNPRGGGTTSVTYTDPNWEAIRKIDRPETVSVGDVVTFTKTIDEYDVERFAAASGDTNRLHLDPSFAEESRFGGPIVHGTLVSGLISAALARLPGLTVYLSQEVTFLKPVEMNDTITAVCEVVEDLGGRTFRLTTCVYNQQEETIIDGEAVVLIDDLPSNTDDE